MSYRPEKVERLRERSSRLVSTAPTVPHSPRERGTVPLTNKRDLPAYGAVEAAHCLALPPATVRWWSLGDERRNHPALIKPAAKGPLCLSFSNLVELYVIASLRRGHRVSMPRVRKALSMSERARPLIEETFWAGDGDLFIERFSVLFNVSSPAQPAMKATLEQSLDRVERDSRGLALRFSPWLHDPTEPIQVEVDPERASGRLVVVRTAIPTEAIAERFVDQVDAAVRWEFAALRAAA
jgi:hypothetical protein